MQSEDNIDASDIKRQYEIEKIKLEVENLRAPWYQKTQNWSLFASTVIALASLLLLIRNGAFDFRARELESKRQNLIYDVNKFTLQKDSLISQIQQLDSMKAELEITRTSNAVNMINSFACERDKAVLQSQIDSLTLLLHR